MIRVRYSRWASIHVLPFDGSAGSVARLELRPEPGIRLRLKPPRVAAWRCPYCGSFVAPVFVVCGGCS